MLNSLELARALLDRGFESLSDPQRTKAHGYRRADLLHPIYVKVAGSKGAIKAVRQRPLVLHVEDAERLRRSGRLPGGMSFEAEPYKSAGLLEFAAKRSSVTPRGYDLGVVDEHTLDQLLTALRESAGLHREPRATDARNPLEQAESVSVQQFQDAFLSLQRQMTPQQLRMLIGHAEAPGQCLSMAAIADLGGYSGFATANVQYGRLGRLFAEHLGVEGLVQQTQMLAFAAETPDEDGYWQWTLRPQLHEALVRLGLLSEPQDDLARRVAAAEIDSDPRCQGASATERLALINARIGQGQYRGRMLDLWGGRCAVTGSALEKVLVASHAQAWADASNEARLDEYNGLLLAASVDRLFDQGLISFGQDGQMLCKATVSANELGLLGLARDSRLRFIHPRHQPYLLAHRRKHGFERD